MSELFYVFGIGLTVMALVVAFAGMRMENFPSRGAYVGGLAVMAFLVVGSAAFAIVLSREEKEHRDEEIAEYREENQDDALAQIDGQAASGGEAGSEETGTVDSESAEAQELELTSPEPGDLVFDPTVLEAEAGPITINYVNPSPVPHNVAIEDGGETVAQGETVTEGGSGPATADLEPGEYIFYCSVPSHRESGMEGKLTVE